MDPNPWGIAIWEVIGVATCVIAAMMLAAAEAALTSLSASRTQRLIDEGDSWMSLWIDRRAMVMTSLLVGKTVASVTAVALTLDIFRRGTTPDAYASWGIWVGIAVASFGLLTVAEVVPKTLGKRHYEVVATRAIRYLQIPYYLFYPLNLIYSKLTQTVLAWFGGDQTALGPVTFDEIEHMIQERGDTSGDERQKLLKSVVEFPDTLVREVMVPRTEIVAVQADMTFDEIIRKLVECGHSRLPVFEDTIDEIVGIFYAKDILRYWAEHRDIEAFDPRLFLREPFVVAESKYIAALLADFQRERTHIAIVIDEFGGTAGIITLEDIIEEVLGDIQDEYDVEPIQLRELGEQRLLADARVPVYEISDFYGVQLPQNDAYDSLGGLLLVEAGEVPSPGDEFTISGLKMTVVEADARRIKAIEIVPCDSKTEFTSEAAS